MGVLYENELTQQALWGGGVSPHTEVPGQQAVQGHVTQALTGHLVGEGGHLIFF